MNLIITRNFPPDVGGMQNLMFGLTKSLSEQMMVKVFADEHYPVSYTHLRAHET